jgi:hypothetical protein
LPESKRIASTALAPCCRACCSAAAATAAAELHPLLRSVCFSSRTTAEGCARQANTLCALYGAGIAVHSSCGCVRVLVRPNSFKYVAPARTTAPGPSVGAVRLAVRDALP